MSNVPISGLPSAASLSGTEAVPIVQSSATVQATTQAIANLAQVNLATSVTGTLPIANGGTGQTSANASLNALLPNQSGHSGEFLTTNGTNASWAAAGGGSTKFAYARINDDGTVEADSSGVTSVTHGGTGQYTVNITAAGFSVIPSVTATVASSGSPAVGTRVDISSSTSITIYAVDGFGGSQDSNVSFIAIGI